MDALLENNNINDRFNFLFVFRLKVIMFAGCNKSVVFNFCRWVVHVPLPFAYVIWVVMMSFVLHG